MRKSLAVFAAAAAFLSLPAGRVAAADHIAAPDAVQSRLVWGERLGVLFEVRQAHPAHEPCLT